MTDNLFGTDGIRSAAGEFPLDEASLLKLGAVIAALAPSPRVLIARDTRESGPAIESLLTRGLGRSARVFSAGVLTTPGLAFLARELEFDLGIMISASHNPFGDNGIKIFNRRGEKLSALLEKRISSGFARPEAGARRAAARRRRDRVRRLRRFPAPPGPRPGPRPGNHARQRLAGRRGLRQRRRLHGRPAPAARAWGCDVAAGHDRPDGRNINRGCGSTFPPRCRSWSGKMAPTWASPSTATATG